jgi:hypothetical protein
VSVGTRTPRAERRDGPARTYQHERGRRLRSGSMPDTVTADRRVTRRPIDRGDLRSGQAPAPPPPIPVEHFAAPRRSHRRLDGTAAADARRARAGLARLRQVGTALIWWCRPAPTPSAPIRLLRCARAVAARCRLRPENVGSCAGGVVNASGPELDQAECPRLVDSGVFLLGALNPPERADYAAHLSRCSACRREVSELAEVAALVSRTTSSASATGSGTTSPRVHHHDPARAARTPRRLPPGAVLVLVAAALGGALALGIGLLTRSGTSDHTTRNSP